MKNNIKLLTKEELNIFIDKYSFKVDGNYIWVTVKNFNRPTIHPINKSFFIATNNRKITIDVDAVKIWNEYFKEYHLIEVQQAMNKLYLMYQQNLNVNDIKKILNNEI